MSPRIRAPRVPGRVRARHRVGLTVLSRPSQERLLESNRGPIVKRLADALWGTSTRKGPCWCEWAESEGHAPWCVDARTAWDEARAYMKREGDAG